MTKNRFERWLKKIGTTQQQEISCSECFDRVSGFVDLELSGEDAVGRMPQLKQHLDHCPACGEEYETLRDLRRLEKEGKLPPVDDLKNLIP